MTLRGENINPKMKGVSDEVVLTFAPVLQVKLDSCNASLKPTFGEMVLPE